MWPISSTLVSEWGAKRMTTKMTELAVNVGRLIEQRDAALDRVTALEALVPTVEELDQLTADISMTGYASEAVEVVEEWTRRKWGVESGLTTAFARSRAARAALSQEAATTQEEAGA